jgi:hypothetical protein
LSKWAKHCLGSAIKLSVNESRFTAQSWSDKLVMDTKLNPDSIKIYNFYKFKIKLQFLFNLQTIQCFGSRVSMSKNLQDLQLKKIIFLTKICNLLITRAPRRTSKLQEKPSALKREHPALQNFSSLFSILWVICVLDPNPHPVDHNQCGFRSEILV